MMKKYLITLAVLIFFCSCHGRDEKIKESLKFAIGSEMQSSGHNDGYHIQAMADTMPHLAALFNATSTVRSVRLNNLLKLFEGRYGYSALDEVELPEIYYLEVTSQNLQMAINAEKYYIESYERILKKLPHKNSDEIRNFLIEAISESRKHLDLYEQAFINLGHDSELPDHYVVCGVCGKLFLDNLIPERDLCKTDSLSIKVYESVASDFILPENHGEQGPE